jgi:transcriptional regulator with XRE-family HTH domain
MHGELGALLRDVRVHANLRQRDVAELAEADQSMISLYERGLREPTWPTFLRLLSAADAVAEVRVANLDGQHLTLESLAKHLRDAESDSRRRRLILDFVGRYRDADAGRRVGLLLGRPESTGDLRWDALLGALAEHLAFHDAVDPPAWCVEQDRFLDLPWYWVDLPSVRRRALLGAPTAFRRRNVWIDRVDLERV